MNEAYRFLMDLDSRETGNQLRLGMGTVRSVEGDPVYGTATGECVIVPATSEWAVDAVTAKFLGEYPPRPGAGCWYVTDGVDRIVLGMVAPEGPPTATVTASTATVTTTGSATYITAASVTLDPWNMSNGTGFLIPVSGVYQFTAQGLWAANAAGFRQLAFRRNLVDVEISRIPAGVANTMYQTVASRPIECSKGDRIDAIVTQNSGGDLNLTSLVMGAAYVGRRRTSGTGDELLRDGGFEDNQLDTQDKTWTSFWGNSATWSLDTGANVYAGSYALKGVHAAGTVVTAINSMEYLPVVPRQKFQVTARVKTSAALAGTTNDYIDAYLICAPDGEPDYFDGVSSIASETAKATTTAYALYTWNLTIPANCFIARLSLRCGTTAGVTVWWDDVSVKEVIN